MTRADWRELAQRRPITACQVSAASLGWRGDDRYDAHAPAKAWLPLAAVACTLVFWASAFVAIRHLGARLLPRRAVARPAAWSARPAWRSWRWPRGLPRPRRGDWLAIVVIGVLWFGVYNVALNEGEQRVDAGTAAMLIQVSPVLIALLAAMFLGERFTVNLGVGLALAFGGVALIAFSRSPGRQQRRRRRAALPAVGGRLLDQPDPAEAAGRPAARGPRDLAGVHRRRRRLPAVRRSAGRARPPTPRRRRSGGWSTSGCSRRRSRSRRTPTRSST